jgi:sterol desaturase/sphingolipid hydroxylase (fatty acid hydroxylase superfamily)
MDVITLDIAFKCWIIFWANYWISGTLITFTAHILKIRKAQDFLKTLSIVSFNMIYSLIGTFLLYLLPLRMMIDYNIIIKLIIIYLVTDLWFYHAHIALHQLQFYRMFHKNHHEFNKPYALTALYCSPFECIFLNSFAAGLGVTLVQLPPPYIYLWFFLVSLNSLLTHSGFYFPFLIDRRHDLHHVTFRYNYGISPIFDYIYGTNIQIES